MNGAEKSMMRKINFFTLCAMLFALSFSASAQQPKKVHRIGYLSATDPTVTPPVQRQFGWLYANWGT